MTCIDIRPVSCALVSGNLSYFLAHFLFFFSFPLLFVCSPFLSTYPPLPPYDPYPACCWTCAAGRLPRSGVEKEKKQVLNDVPGGGCMIDTPHVIHMHGMSMGMSIWAWADWREHHIAWGFRRCYVCWHERSSGGRGEIGFPNRYVQLLICSNFIPVLVRQREMFCLYTEYAEGVLRK